MVSSFRHGNRVIVRVMERDETYSRDVVIEALLAPGKGSFVDALLALADEAADHDRPGAAQQALLGGFQAALARRMRAAIAQENEGGVADAA